MRLVYALSYLALAIIFRRRLYTFNVQAYPIRVSIAPTSTTQNVIAGQPPEIITKALILTLYGCAETVGALTHALQWNNGAEGGLYVAPGAILPLASTAGGIKVNEAFIGQFPVAAGTRLIHSVTNSTGTAAFADFQYNLG